jgi:uncharacterized membrane protein
MFAPCSTQARRSLKIEPEATAFRPRPPWRIFVMNSRFVASSALASVIAMGLVSGAHAADEKSKEKEKCYGIAKAGSNDCANLSGSHSCAGQAKVAQGPDEWNYVTKGTCAKIGGMTAEEAKAAMKK